ncbi:MAG: prephenate dehydratase [ANME-2 cluster archaeon]|nr:prephenate dehydratase [ANME-2 cluster archaeon]
MIIGLLGPQGTYSQKAANQLDIHARLKYFDDLEDVIGSVLAGDVDCSILPIENSLEGSIGITLDALKEHDITITGEIIVPIRHCLLSKGHMEDVKIILSHPQGLAQCRRFIRTHFKNARTQTTGSTSHAAKLTSEFPEMAAIASRESALHYGLDILADDIQDHKENYTRFVVLGKQMPEPTGHDKTSIIIHLGQDRPGVLYDLLGEFASRNINLTKIESRPSKLGLGDYLFYIDMEGHQSDTRLKDALKGIENLADQIKVIGSYPMGIRKIA